MNTQLIYAILMNCHIFCFHVWLIQYWKFVSHFHFLQLSMPMGFINSTRWHFQLFKFYKLCWHDFQQVMSSSPEKLSHSSSALYYSYPSCHKSNDITISGLKSGHAQSLSHFFLFLLINVDGILSSCSCTSNFLFCTTSSFLDIPHSCICICVFK